MSGQVVAIDGPAGSGKSTVAKSLATQLGWSFLDTGAMYRAVTLVALERGLSLGDQEAVADLARSLVINTLPRVTVNGRDVEDEIRTETINIGVSVVAANPLVRETMVKRQREIAAAQPHGTVVEGRDITTVVFPNASLKIFLTASLDERVLRRGEEGADSVARRDDADSNRAASPLRQASDALVVDTTHLSVEDVVQEIIRCLKNQR